MEHYKVGIINKIADARATEITLELLESQVMIEAVGQARWWQALRVIQRRFEQSEYNQDGTKWVFIPIGSDDDKAVTKLMKLFPDVVEKAIPTPEEVEEAYAE